MGRLPLRNASTVIAAVAALVLSTAAPHQLRAQTASYERTIQQAADVRAKGDLQQAVQLLTSALSESGVANDRRAVALNDRAMIYVQLGDYDKAFEDFNASAELYPENAALYNNRGAVLTTLGLHGEAVKDLDRAIKLAPGYATAYTNRALAEVAEGRLGSALLDFRQAVKLFEDKSEPLLRRAAVNLERNRPNAAMRDIDRAITFDERDAEAYRLRAAAFQALGRADEALDDLSRAIAFAPDDTDALMNRGEAYLKRGDFGAAIADFSKVVSLDENHVEAWRSRGHAHILSNDVETAETDLARALELAPRAAETYAYRALLYKKIGQPDQGQREIQAAEQIEPENAVVLWARGEIEEAVGNIEAAADSYRAALERDSKLKPAELGLSRLGKAPLASEETVLADAGQAGWTIVFRNDRFFVRNASINGITVPIEPIDAAEPRVIGWDVRTTDTAEVGILTVQVGEALARDEKAVALQISALIDLKRNRLLTVAPMRLGEIEGEVDINVDVVTFEAADGLVDRIPLIERPQVSASAAAAAAAAARRRTRRDSNGTPYWAPWANQDERAYRRSAARRSYQRRRRSKPKSLLNLLFGN